MMDFYENNIQPAYEHMYDLLATDFDPFPNSYMVIRNGKSVRKVIVANPLGTHVEYKMKNGKLEVVRDWEAVPF